MSQTIWRAALSGSSAGAQITETKEIMREGEHIMEADP